MIVTCTLTVSPLCAQDATYPTPKPTPAKIEPQIFLLAESTELSLGLNNYYFLR
jgi:hypothetical protein